MATETESTAKDISVFFQDILKKIWKDGDRPWDVYMKKQSSYFWDNRDVVDRSR